MRALSKPNARGLTSGLSYESTSQRSKDVLKSHARKACRPFGLNGSKDSIQVEDSCLTSS